MPGRKTVSILGCGWYGFSLGRVLVEKGVIVKGSTTSVNRLQQLTDAGIRPYLVNFTPDDATYDAQFFDCDILWICFPPKVGAGNGEDYLNKIQRVINKIKSYSIKQVVFISSTGVYGDINGEVNELNEPKPDSASGKVLLEAESRLRQQTEFQTTIIRFAGLIGPGREPGRFLAGKKEIPNGNAPVNLIHLSDCIGISCAIIDKQAFGTIYNACSPSHPGRADFYSKAAANLGLEPPEFIMEQKNWKIVSGIYADTILHYQYQVNDLMGWLD